MLDHGTSIGDEESSQGEPVNDLATIYSSTQNLDDYHLTVYESELADSLANWVRNLHPDRSSKELLVEALPDMLKAFALRIGQGSTAKSENEVMCFVHRSRE